MRQEPIIDVEFSEVGKTKAPHWYEAPYLVEDVMRLICGSAMLVWAAYCFHLWLANNFG